MNKVFSWLRRVGLASAAILLSALSPNALAAPTTDALERASVSSPRALRALMTGVAQAGQRLIGVGERGVILLSDDNGTTWRQARQVPVSVTLTRVQFVDERRGWAVGHSGVVLHSEDAGETWRKQLDGRQAAAIEKAAAERAGDPVRLANAQHLVTDGPDKPLFGLHFSSTLDGMVTGAYGLMLRTEDGGKTWQSAMDALSNPKGRHLYSIATAGGTAPWFIVGEQGALYRSRDGGRHFEELASPGRSTYFGAVSCGTSCVVAYGLRGSAHRSTDGGTSWQPITLPAATVTGGLRLDERTLVLANEAGQLLVSRDSGASFTVATHQPSGSVVGLASAGDASIVAAGIRNMQRIALRTESAPETAK